MRYLLFFLVSTPVLACKMTAEGAKRKAEVVAREVVTKRSGQTQLKTYQKGLFWYVRTTKLNCVEYQVEIDYGKGDCVTTAKILSEKPCP